MEETVLHESVSCKNEYKIGKSAKSETFLDSLEEQITLFLSFHLKNATKYSFVIAYGRISNPHTTHIKSNHGY